MKHIIVLPDGREISSGDPAGDAIVSLEWTQTVNDGVCIAPGSVCAAMVRITLFSESFVPEAGQEITLFAEDGQRRKLGVFLTEKPERTGVHTVTVTAYDRVSRLDTDVTDYLAGLSGWPYTLGQLAEGICNRCGVVLAGEDLPNGDHPVRRFAAEGVTGRQVMQWIGQAAGRFCRANADGDLEFAWYRPTGKEIRGREEAVGTLTVEDGTLTLSLPEDSSGCAGGVWTPDSRLIWEIAEDGQAAANFGRTQFYYQDGCRFSDFTTAPIQRVQICASQEDVGTVYPDVTGNTLVIRDNPLLTAQTAEELLPVAQEIFRTVSGVQYTPCTLLLPREADVQAGEILSVTDGEGRRFTAYIMTVSLSGGRLTASCTGEPTLEQSSLRNRSSYRALSGQILTLKTDVEGIRAENRDAAGRVSRMELDVTGIRAAVSEQTAGLDTVRTQMTSLSQKTDSVELEIRQIAQNGADKICTGLGYTFDDTGLQIRRMGGEMQNLLDDTGMYVTRSGQEILTASNVGVSALNLTARQFLTVGNNARFEDCGDSVTGRRTACFFTGG